MQLTTKSYKVILIMGLLTAIGPLSIDIYLPAFPAIAHDLHTTVSQVTLSLSTFFIGISLGQLMYGPLLERFGRKQPLYAGLVLYLIASLACALAPSIQWLIVARLFQAIGGCVGLVAARAMVRDLFEVKENAKVFSMLMLVVAVSPIIAPTLGGYITAAWGWRYVFAVLVALILLIVMGTYFYLPESKPPNKSYSLMPRAILQSFQSIIREPTFSRFAFTGAISYGGLYAYVGGSPFIFMKVYQVTEAQFGWIFSLVAAGIISASQVNNWAMKRLSSQRIVLLATQFQTLFGGLFCLLSLTGNIHLFSTILLVFLFLACQGFIFPNTTAMALAPLGNQAGNASALIGSIQMTIGAAAAALVGLLQQQTASAMACVMAGCALLAFFVVRINRSNTAPLFTAH